MSIMETSLDSATLVYSLVGIVFVTMIGIIVHHLHITYTAKSAMWLKVRTGLTISAKKLQESSPPKKDVRTHVHSLSHDPHKIVTKTVTF